MREILFISKFKKELLEKQRGILLKNKSELRQLKTKEKNNLIDQSAFIKNILLNFIYKKRRFNK